MASHADVALSYFRKPPHRLSCCQAVIAAYKGIDDPLVKQTQAYGGGSAPDGYCGAAHAVRMLRPDLEEVVLENFKKEAQSVKCREIKGRGASSYPCQGCVSLACKILDEHAQ